VLTQHSEPNGPARLLRARRDHAAAPTSAAKNFRRSMWLAI